jgi:hypothetical protein
VCNVHRRLGACHLHKKNPSMNDTPEHGLRADLPYTVHFSCWEDKENFLFLARLFVYYILLKKSSHKFIDQCIVTK